MRLRDQLVSLVRRITSEELNRRGEIAAWGEVTGVSPLTVRVAGDTVDIKPADTEAGLALATNDRVVLLNVQGQWVVIGEV